MDGKNIEKATLSADKVAPSTDKVTLSADKTVATVDNESMVRKILHEHVNTGLTKLPEIVIFDISNTLIDSKEVEIEALNNVLTYYGKPKWEEGTQQKKDPLKSIKQNFPSFFGTDWQDAYKLYIKYMLDHKDRTPLIEGARELLEYLHQNNITTVVVSNRDRDFSTKLLEYHHVNQYVTAVIGADDTPYAKPDPRMPEHILTDLGHNAKDSYTLFVGDALVDIQCADSAGCQPVLITKYITDITADFIAERIRKKPEKGYDLQSVPNHFGIIKLIDDIKIGHSITPKVLVNERKEIINKTE